MRLVIAIIGMLLLPTVAFSATIYVPDNYATIQDAINASVAGDTVIVRSGTYFESIDFVGKAIAVRSEQGPAVTIIDAGMAWTCVAFEKGEGSDSILEGFTVQNGACRGITCSLSSPTIRGNLFTGNSANDGGVIYCNTGSSPTISGNTFDGNFDTCIVSHVGSPVIENNVIANTITMTPSGGIACINSCGILITGNVISNNSGHMGAAVGIIGNSSRATIVNNIITGNHSSNLGGAISCASDTIVTISNNLIAGNSADGLGGGIYLGRGSFVLVGNTITGNTAPLGGGIYCRDSSVLIRNTILWDNKAPTGKEIYGTTVPQWNLEITISYSDVEGGQASVFMEPGAVLNWGAGMIDSDPLFLTGPLGDFYLSQDPAQPGVVNACVDGGDPVFSPNGTTRTDHIADGGFVDVGFHFRYSTGSTIQGAIDLAPTGSTIVIQPGIYHEMIDFRGKAIRLVSASGPESTIIDGDRAGSVVTFWNGEGRDSVIEGFTITNGKARMGGGICCHPQTSPTIRDNIISGNMAESRSLDWGGGIYCFETAAPLITGNVITGNFASYCGGGIECDQSSPEIIGNVISDNVAKKRGGGIDCDTSSAVIEDNLIVSNSAEMGGGISVGEQSVIEIKRNVVINNSAENGGGAKFSDSNVKLTGNLFAGNSASVNGGAIFCWDLQLNLINNTITKNVAAGQGGGLYTITTDTTIANTIFWNDSAPFGPEIAATQSSQSTTLAAGFSDVEGGQASVYLQNGVTLNWGAGMIDADPRLVDPAADDFHLPYNSPCRNAGDGSVPGLPTKDFEGDPRVFCGCVDIGADEFHPHLYYTGKAVPGGSVDIKLIAPPTVWACLLRGSGIQDPPLTTPYGDFHLSLPLLGKWTTQSMPLNGVKTKYISIPSATPPGKLFPFQALVGPIATYPSSFTNLMTLTVE